MSESEDQYLYFSRDEDGAIFIRYGARDWVERLLEVEDRTTFLCGIPADGDPQCWPGEQVAFVVKGKIVVPQPCKLRLPND